MYQALINFRSRLLVFLTHRMALPFLKLVRGPECFPFSLSGLKAMPAGSLGNDLFHFLENKKLDLLPHYAKHDIKHVLLQYDTTEDSEVCLQCFMLGNGHLSFPVAATVLYGLFTMPEHWKKFRKAYARGKNAGSLKNWKWFELMPEKTALLIEKINRL